MQTWIALLRGINVGGNNILPMKDLRALLTGLGLEAVQTYIQSGNCVFQASTKDPSALSRTISAQIEARFGFAPQVMVLPVEDLKTAIEANPFPHGRDDPKSVHLSFMTEAPADLPRDALDAIKRPSEQYALRDRVFYLHAPDGIGRSKLAAQAEKIMGVPMTARNLRSAIKILDLAV